MPIPVFTHLGLDHIIGEDAGEVRLDGLLLPGIIQALRIPAALYVDRARMVSGAHRSQPIGFDVPVVTLTLALTSDPPGFFSAVSQIQGFASTGSLSDAEAPNTCYGKARALDSLFRSMDPFGNPRRWRLTNPHANSRGVREVWFTRLNTGEAHGDVIQAELEFEQVETESFAQIALGAAAGAP